MQLSYFVALFTATVAMAAPNPAPEEAPALKSRQDACLPASCASFGVSTQPFLHIYSVYYAKKALSNTGNSIVLLGRLRLLVCKYCPSSTDCSA